MSSGSEPIFLLCYARSGSTLLRYILDTHPEICAPPELHLLHTARQLLWVYTHTASVPGETPDPEARARYAARRTEQTISTLMNEYAHRAGKRLWCEKSVASVDCLDVLDTVYPAARVVCLHRQALDVVASCTEAARSRQGGFGFEPYMARTPDNALDGLADYWIDKTRRILEYERLNPGRCFRIRYEDIVNHGHSALAGLFDFLGLDWNRDILATVFSTPHAAGPGDSKILHTSRIGGGSVGRGAQLPADAVSPQRRYELDRTLGELGYTD